MAIAPLNDFEGAMRKGNGRKVHCAVILGGGDGPLKKSYLWWRSAGYFQLSVDFSILVIGSTGD